MKSSSFFFILLFCCFQQGFSQGNESFLPPTKENNERWLDSLEQISNIEKRWFAVKHKIFADSKFYTQKTSTYSFKGRVKIRRVANCECKLLFLLVHDKKEFKLSLDLGEDITQRSLLESIGKSSIKEVLIVEEWIAKALYGVRGQCGVVIIHGKGSKLRKQLKSHVNQPL